MARRKTVVGGAHAGKLSAVEVKKLREILGNLRDVLTRPTPAARPSTPFSLRDSRRRANPDIAACLPNRDLGQAVCRLADFYHKHPEVQEWFETRWKQLLEPVLLATVKASGAFSFHLANRSEDEIKAMRPDDVAAVDAVRVFCDEVGKVPDCPFEQVFPLLPGGVIGDIYRWQCRWKFDPHLQVVSEKIIDWMDQMGRDFDERLLRGMLSFRLLSQPGLRAHEIGFMFSAEDTYLSHVANRDGLLRLIKEFEEYIDGHKSDSDTRSTGEPPVKSHSPEHRLLWLAQAMLLVQDEPNLPDAEIARRVGKDKSTLSRHPAYQVAASKARGKKDALSGFVATDSETRDRLGVEAEAPVVDQADRGQQIPGSKLFREYCADCGEAIGVTAADFGKNLLCRDCKR